MRKTTVSLLLALVVLISTGAAQAYIVASWGNSWLEEVGDGRPDQILHLNESTPYLNGYAQGVLLSTQVAQTVRAYLQYGLNNGFTEADGVALWNQQAPYVLQEFKDEVQGIADGSGVPLSSVQAVHAFPSRFSCCGFAAKAGATTNGQVYQGRSLDYPTDITDPQTGITVQENGLVTIWHRTGEAHVSWAGMCGSVGGTRVGAITVGEQTQKIGGYATYSGNNMIFQCREAVRANSAQAAAEVFTVNPTKGYSFQTSDSAGNIRCVEVAGPQAYYIGDENGYESFNSHFWYVPNSGAIPNVVRRTNCFIAPNTQPYQTPGEGWEAHLALFTDALDNYENAGINCETGSQALADTYTALLGIPEWGFGVTSEHQWCINTNTGEMKLRRATRSDNAFRANGYTYWLASELAETLPAHHIRVPMYPWGTPTTFSSSGGTVNCHASCSCNQGHAATYYWQAFYNGVPANDGTWTTRTSPDATWKAPKNSSWTSSRYYTVRCTMSCAGGAPQVIGEFQVRVKSVLGL